MKGTMLFTDKDHLLAPREIFPGLPVPAAQALTVASAPLKPFYGAGVAITPSSCYELSLMDSAERKALLTQLYGKEGLGLSVTRLCIGSSDYSPELYSYDDEPFDRELKHFSVARDEKYVIPMIKEILEINPRLFLFASPWSPPGWMKTGGQMCGGYMREEFLDCYGDYIVKFLQAYAGYGIHVSALTVQNEPNTQQGGKMPACIWHPETEAKFIGILKQKLAENGLDVKIWMFDHNFSDTDRVLWALQNCQDLAKNCDGVAFHYYTGTIQQTQAISRQFPELELHFTEGGPRLNDHYDTDWCKWGVILLEALKSGFRSFTGWNLMLDECGGPNIGPFLGTCGGLVTRDSRDGSLRYSGMYKAFAHIVPHITPGAQLFPICADNTPNWIVGNYPKYVHSVAGILIRQESGKKVAILVNPNAGGMQAQLALDGQLWYVELPGDGICTLIIEE